MRKPSGELGATVTGNGVLERLTEAELSIAGVSTHTLPTAQVPAID